MSTTGHNSKVKAGPISADRLKSFIERIEKLEEERKAIGGDIKDVYAEAKGVGYDVATMRKIVALRAKDPADRAEAETLLDVYKHALGMETSGTVTVMQAQPSEEDLEARAGRIVAEVDRCMSLVSKHGDLPKIEAIKELIGCSNGKAFKLRGMVEKRLGQFSLLSARVRENENPADGVVTETQESCGADIEQPATDGGRDAVNNQGGNYEAHLRSLDDFPGSISCEVVPEVARVAPPVFTEADEAPAPPSVGAVADASVSEGPRVAPPIDDATALAAMDEAYLKLQSARRAKQERAA
jgi:uncharacterized protein (UPF0335 family)